MKTKTKLAFYLLEKEFEKLENPQDYVGGREYKYVTDLNTGQVARYYNDGGLSWYFDNYAGSVDPNWSGARGYYDPRSYYLNNPSGSYDDGMPPIADKEPTSGYMPPSSGDYTEYCVYGGIGSANPADRAMIYYNLGLNTISNSMYFSPGDSNSAYYQNRPEGSFSLQFSGGIYSPSEVTAGEAYNLTSLTYKSSVARFHSHPNSNREPSAADVIAFAGLATTPGNQLEASYVITQNGTAYALILTDATAAKAFYDANKGSLNGNNWDGSSNAGTMAKAMHDILITQDFSENDAMEMAQAMVVQNSGISLLKMSPSASPYQNQFVTINP